jgi:hypothetical protein
MRTPAGKPIFSIATGLAAGAGLAAIMCAGILLHRRRPWALVGATVATMLLLQAVFINGFGRSAGGQNYFFPISEEIRVKFPAAAIVFPHARHRSAPVDFWMFLDRPIDSILPSEAAAIQQGSRPIIAIVDHSDVAKEDPWILHAPWTYFKTLKHGEDTWDIFALPAAGKL